MLDRLLQFVQETGFYALISGFFSDGNWKYLVMILVSLLLLWLAIKKKFEPLLLVGIAFGMLLTNLTALVPGNEMYHSDMWAEFMREGSEYYHSYGHILSNGGLLDILYIGVKTCLYP